MFREFEIFENEKIEENIFLLKLKKNFPLKAFPGQFAMIRVNDSYDPLLSRPLSFYKVSENTIEFLYQVKGKGTYLLSKKRVGERLKILAPLGNSFPMPEKGEKIAIIGGGMGIVPLSFLLDFIHFLDVNIYSFIGFSTKVSEKIWKNFEEKSKKFLISTEDGSFGEKGKILEYISELREFNKVYACGPIPMLKELWKKLEEKSKLYFSLEERMGCGIGICLSCVLMGSKKNLHICKDGPVISGMEVNFE
ncbi:MAG: dihydroorotate dehydrogenase electron transfer subunit [Dictyoglomaceae bacterium]